MSIVSDLQAAAVKSLSGLYNQPFTDKDFQVNLTKPEFEGDYTVVLFSLLKKTGKSPDALGQELGNDLVSNNPQLFTGFNIIKGFLNLSVADTYWLDLLKKQYNDRCYGSQEMNGKKVMVEYSSPNTNKPLHLGHLRNNFLGWSVAEILKHAGYEVVKSCIVNDRGVHICKSMIAWQLFADGAEPQTNDIKGDHFVGEYYVKFNDEIKKQQEPIVDLIYRNKANELLKNEDVLKVDLHLKNLSNYEAQLKKTKEELDWKTINSFGFRITVLAESASDGTIKWKDIIKGFNDEEYNNLTSEQKEQKEKALQKILKPVTSLEEKIKKERDEIIDIAQKYTAIMKATQQMLQDWEAGEPAVMDLWRKMNGWVYEGFDITYKNIGSDFDKTYYESNTYLLGKGIVEKGLEKNVFFRKDDSSIWIDLTADGLDEKLVMRKDGTSVYITQDIGLAQQKYDEYKIDGSIYVIGDEQNYHMKVLKLIAQKLAVDNADAIHHLSYGMVELTTGKMKSREGTVVDADDLVDEMISTARQHTEELGKVKDFTPEELVHLYKTIGLGALKFYLLRVDPKKRMVFNPQESIDFHGFTGPFVQYTYARIKSILRKEQFDETKTVSSTLLKSEKDILVAAEQYPSVISEAAKDMDPSKVAMYIFNLAKTFNSFYSELSVANAESEEKKQLRLQLAIMTANILKSGMQMLGIEVPERM